MSDGKMTMGVKITELRKSKQLTQADLAERMRVTDKAVSKWERDVCCPDVASMPRLAAILGVSVDELLNAGIPSRSQTKVEKVLPLVFKAVSLAMGVAVIVLTRLGDVDVVSALSMLGIGLACLAIESFQ